MEVVWGSQEDAVPGVAQSRVPVGSGSRGGHAYQMLVLGTVYKAADVGPPTLYGCMCMGRCGPGVVRCIPVREFARCVFRWIDLRGAVSLYVTFSIFVRVCCLWPVSVCVCVFVCLWDFEYTGVDVSYSGESGP